MVENKSLETDNHEQLFVVGNYGKSVGRVNTAETYGTGSCIMWNGCMCLVTNHHVISTKEIARDRETFVEFGYLESFCPSLIKVYLDPDTYYWTSPRRGGLDITIVAFKKAIGLRPLPIEFDEVPLGRQVVVCGHPDAKPFTFSFGAIDSYGRNGQFFYSVPTQVGSSGSPVIDCTTGRSVGTHHYQQANVAAGKSGLRQGSTFRQVKLVQQREEWEVSA